MSSMAAFRGRHPSSVSMQLGDISRQVVHHLFVVGLRVLELRAQPRHFNEDGLRIRIGRHCDERTFRSPINVSLTDEKADSHFAMLLRNACDSSDAVTAMLRACFNTSPKPMRIDSIFTCCSNATCLIRFFSASAFATMARHFSSNIFVRLASSLRILDNTHGTHPEKPSSRRCNASMASCRTRIPFCYSWPSIFRRIPWNS